MEAGDLLIFNTLLTHGVRPNHSKDRVRMAQYISMHPAEPDNEEERQSRIHSWRHLEPPQRDAFPGDPRDWEKRNATTAKLTPLGERLLGSVPWWPMPEESGQAGGTAMIRAATSSCSRHRCGSWMPHASRCATVW